MYIISGCNGAGKTTAAYTILPDIYKFKQFVNSDEIARILNPANPDSEAIRASRILLERMNELIER
ncbi:MAG: zeta toxin, partial [Bacteroidales bacterium]|nr:zeta toxin [Bacteroidales bacterium]